MPHHGQLAVRMRKVLAKPYTVHRTAIIAFEQSISAYYLRQLPACSSLDSNLERWLHKLNVDPWRHNIDIDMGNAKYRTRIASILKSGISTPLLKISLDIFFSSLTPPDNGHGIRHLSIFRAQWWLSIAAKRWKRPFRQNIQVLMNDNRAKVFTAFCELFQTSVSVSFSRNTE